MCRLWGSGHLLVLLISPNWIVPSRILSSLCSADHKRFLTMSLSCVAAPDLSPATPILSGCSLLSPPICQSQGGLLCSMGRGTGQEGHFFVIQEELCSPSGSEGRDSVCPVSLFFLLPERCHPQALGYVLDWACGGGSAGCVTHQPFSAPM